MSEQIETTVDITYVPEPIEVLKARGESVPLHKWFKKVKSEAFRLSRDDIHPADYNPRAIDLPAQIKLRNGLRKFGMVDNFTWNIRTGNLVGGHQRLALMDQEFGKDTGYSVYVTIVDYPVPEEKALNVLLNNDGAQGMFDWTKLGTMLANEKEFDIDDAGFDSVGLQRVLQAYVPDYEKLDLSHLFPPVEDPAKQTAEDITAMKASKEEHREQSGNANKDGFYLQLVFGTMEEKEAFAEYFGVSPEAKTVSGRVVAKRLDVDIGYEYPDDPDEEGDSEIEEASETEGLNEHGEIKA